jgi:hypothetical protein
LKARNKVIIRIHGIKGMPAYRKNHPQARGQGRFKRVMTNREEESQVIRDQPHATNDQQQASKGNQALNREQATVQTLISKQPKGIKAKVQQGKPDKDTPMPNANKTKDSKTGPTTNKIIRPDNGKRNQHKNKLSQSAPTEMPEIELTRAAIIKEQARDSFCREIYNFLQYQILPQNEKARSILFARESDFFVHQGILYKMSMQNINSTSSSSAQIVVPHRLKTQLLQLFHDSPLGAHLGASKIIHKMRVRYFWPRLVNDVYEYVSSCTQCLKAKAPRQKYMSPLRPQPTPSQAFERVCCDFSGPYHVSNMSNHYICVVTDYYSKYVIIWAMPVITAAVFARDFYDHVICTQSVPKLIQMDRGSQFSSKVFTNICKAFQIEQRFSPAFWPRSQGITE